MMTYADLRWMRGTWPESIRSTSSRTAPLPPEACSDDIGFAQHRGPRIGGSSGQAGNFHGGEIVDVVAHEADFVQLQALALRESTQRAGLVLAAFGDVGEIHLRGETVHQRAVFAGDERHDQARFAGQRHTHDVGEGEPLPLGSVGTPPDAAIGQDSIYIQCDGFERTHIRQPPLHGAVS